MSPSQLEPGSLLHRVKCSVSKFGSRIKSLRLRPSRTNKYHTFCTSTGKFKSFLCRTFFSTANLDASDIESQAVTKLKYNYVMVPLVPSFTVVNGTVKLVDVLSDYEAGSDGNFRFGTYSVRKSESFRDWMLKHFSVTNLTLSTVARSDRTLVLDLDETLIEAGLYHCTCFKNEPQFPTDSRGCKGCWRHCFLGYSRDPLYALQPEGDHKPPLWVAVTHRPHLYEFLYAMGLAYGRICIFSASHVTYCRNHAAKIEEHFAEWLLENKGQSVLAAFGRPTLFHRICHRGDCLRRYKTLKKDLSIFCDEKVTMNDIVFVDDKPGDYQIFEQQYHTIQMPRWDENLEWTDDWLKILIPLLTYLAHVPNIPGTIRSLVRKWYDEEVVGCSHFKMES